MKILNSKITPRIMSSCPNSEENMKKLNLKRLKSNHGLPVEALILKH